MKRFTFSLEKVRELKTQMLDREKNTLAALRRELSVIDAELQRLEQEFQDANREAAEKARQGVTARELRALQLRMDDIRRDQKEQEQARAAQERRVEAQLAVVLEASQSVSGLDKLKEYQKQEFDQETAKAQEAEIAEFVSGKLVRQQQAGPSAL